MKIVFVYVFKRLIFVCNYSNELEIHDTKTTVYNASYMYRALHLEIDNSNQLNSIFAITEMVSIFTM